MMRLFERRRGRGLRWFTLAPLYSYKCKYLFFDTDGLYWFLRSIPAHVLPFPVPNLRTFRINFEFYWNSVFDIPKFTSEGRRFAYSL